METHAWQLKTTNIPYSSLANPSFHVTTPDKPTMGPMQLNSLRPSAICVHNKLWTNSQPYLRHCRKLMSTRRTQSQSAEEHDTWNLDIISKCFFMSVPRTMLVLF